MVELNNSSFSYDLAGYIFLNPSHSVSDFDSIAFNKIKPMIKVQLHREQGGLCVYCEKKLIEEEGHVEHIKPKSIYPNLCFQYINYAHSCDNKKTCGHKKQNNELSIEPKIGCNDNFSLSTDGSIIPIISLSKKDRNILDNTMIKRLGLNNSALKKERKNLIDIYLKLLKTHPQNVNTFMQNQPFLYIFKRL